MSFADYTLKYYIIDLSYFLSKNVHEVSLHDNYMNNFNKKGMFYDKILQFL